MIVRPLLRTLLLTAGCALYVAGVVDAMQPASAVALVEPNGRAIIAAQDTSRAALIEHATKFFRQWQEAWLDSEQERLKADRKRGVDVAAEARIRRPQVHCHGQRGSMQSPYNSSSLQRNYVAISSAFSAFGVCPTWVIGDTVGADDEATTIDAAIAPERRRAIRTARASLIARFRAASAVLPTDVFLVGQHVRFLLDQNERDRALVVARRCESEPWWCASLEGYVHYKQGHIPAADTAFARARLRMPASLRCAWDDVGPYLQRSDSLAFVNAGCDATILLAERWWWLADPLYVDKINERRVAHDARTVLVALVGSLPVDGRRRWTAEFGRDALERMLLRYGWPGRVAWLGVQEDKNHDRWMLHQKSELQPPYTTFEYARERIATDPRLSALRDPLALPDTAWQVNAPATLARNREWWPRTHFARTRPLTQLPPGQVALFRREADAKLAFANTLNGAEPSGTASRLTLISSPAPASSTPLVQQSVTAADTTVVLTSRLAALPTLLALEVQSDRDATGDQRTRFGITPPPTLRQMQPGEVALSDPVLLAPADGAGRVTQVDSLLRARMLASTRLSLKQTPRVDVFWESYGVRPEDSATMSVRIEREQRLGVFHRLTIALRLRDDPNATVTVTWRDAPTLESERPSADTRTGLVQGMSGIPVHARAVTLDLRRLSPGPYTLSIELARRDGTTAGSRRSFTLLP